MASFEKRDGLILAAIRHSLGNAVGEGNAGWFSPPFPVGVGLASPSPLARSSSPAFSEYLSRGLCVRRRAESRLRRANRGTLGSSKAEPGTSGAQPAFSHQIPAHFVRARQRGRLIAHLSSRERHKAKDRSVARTILCGSPHLALFGGLRNPEVRQPVTPVAEFDKSERRTDREQHLARTRRDLQRLTYFLEGARSPRGENILSLYASNTEMLPLSAKKKSHNGRSSCGGSSK